MSFSQFLDENWAFNFVENVAYKEWVKAGTRRKFVIEFSTVLAISVDQGQFLLVLFTFFASTLVVYDFSYFLLFFLVQDSMVCQIVVS